VKPAAPPPKVPAARPAVPPPAPPKQPTPDAPPTQYAGPRTVEQSNIVYVSPPRPVYPTRAREHREMGTALVRVLIDEAGKPTRVTLEKTTDYWLLDEEAVRSVKAAVFKPYMESGVPQSVSVVIPVHFILLRDWPQRGPMR
jgi:protein TonB